MLRKQPYIIAAMIIPFIASLFYFEIFDGHKMAPNIYLGAKIFLLLMPIIFIKKTDKFSNVFSFKLKEFLFGLTIGAIILVTGYYAINLPIVMNYIQPATPFIKSKLANFGVTNHYIQMAIIISFIHSMLEEYYWRWFVFGISRKNILSATAFSLHHFVVLNYYFIWQTALVLTIVVAIGGVIFNLLYARKNNIWGAWAAHVGADLVIFYVGYLLIN